MKSAWIIEKILSHLSEKASSTEKTLLPESRAPPHARLYDCCSTTSSTHQIAAKRKVSVGLTIGIDQNAVTKVGISFSTRSAIQRTSVFIAGSLPIERLPTTSGFYENAPLIRLLSLYWWQSRHLRVGPPFSPESTVYL
jgi:hypothetical protein